MEYLSGSNVITRVLRRGRQESKREDVGIEADIRVKEGIMNEGCRLPVEAGNGKETDSPLEPPEGMPPCQLLGFNPKNCFGLLTS